MNSSALYLGKWLLLLIALIAPIALSLPTELINSSQLYQDLDSNNHGSQEKMVRKTRNVDDAFEDELPVASLTPQEILQLLTMRNQNRFRSEPRARMLIDEFTDKDISEICGTSASLKCGREVLMAFSEDSVDVEEKCNIRKTFLDCIDDSRKECRVMAKSGVFPLLPPQGDIAKFQGKVWRALWTSGGCLLAN